MSTQEELHDQHAEEDRAAVESAIALLMKSYEGQKFLWWLLQQGKALGHNPFAPNSLNMSFECGIMFVGQQVLAQITSTDVNFLPKLMLEMENERARRSAEHRDGNRDGDGPDDDLWRLDG